MATRPTPRPHAPEPDHDLNANHSRPIEQTAPRFGLVLDCVEPNRLADFWGPALDYINVGAAGAYVALYPRTGDGRKLLLQ